MTRAVIIITLALGMAAPVHAGPDRWSILLGSEHVGGSSFEQVNPGLFATWEDRALGLDYSIGAYRNSYGRGSVAVTVAWPVWRHNQSEVSLFAGVALYPRDGRHFDVHLGDVVPVGGVQARWSNSFIQIIPGDGKAARAVISFGITFP